MCVFVQVTIMSESSLLSLAPFHSLSPVHSLACLLLSSCAVQFVVANSDKITAFEEFKDRSKPLFIIYKKGAKLTVSPPPPSPPAVHVS